MEILLLVPVFISLLFGIVLTSYGFNKNREKGILGIVLLSATYTFIALYFYFLKKPQIYLYFGFGFSVSILCFFPLLLKYLKALSGRSLKNELLHFLPSLLVLLVAIPLWLSMTKQEAISFIEHRQEMLTMGNTTMKSLNILAKAVRFTAIIQLILYAYIMYKELGTTKKSLRNYYSNLKGKELIWLQILVIPLVLFLITLIVFASLNNQIYFNNGLFLPISYTISSIFFFLLGWFGLRQSNLAIPETIKLESDPYEDSNNINLSKEKLSSYFKEYRPYLSPNFKITDLSEELCVNRTYMSNFINEAYGTNFCKFVNNYRIEEAKAKLKDNRNKQFKLDKLAEECGFSSLQSFSRVFKEHCNMSPGKYRSSITSKT